MFSCEETWDVYLSFGKKKRHVRTFILKPISSVQRQQTSDTLWFRLPRDSDQAEYKIDDAIVHPIEEGLDRGIDISPIVTETRVCVSFETPQDRNESCCTINYRYPIPRHASWRVAFSDHTLELKFHLPIGLPPNWTEWIHRLGFLSIIFGRNRWIEWIRTRLPGIFKDFYSLPWGYVIEYGAPKIKGRLDSLCFIPRRIIYNNSDTRWMIKGSTLGPFIDIRPNSVIEALVIAAIIGLLIERFFPSFPIWFAIVALCLLLPIFSHGLLWKLFHLFK